ncbi:MAG: PilN domain-containing protein [bacterium]
MKIYLDLLPRERKAELKRKKLFRRILHEEFLFLMPLIVLIVIFINIYYLLINHRNAFTLEKTATQSMDKYQELNSYTEKFKQVNDDSAKLLKIQTGHLIWSEIFNKLSSDMPENVYITDFSTKEYKIFLLGKAKNRDALLGFRDNLGNDSCFADINVPISNLVVKDDIDFQIDLSINKECLKKHNE